MILILVVLRMYFDNEAFLSMILGVQHVLELCTYLCRGSSRVGHVLILIILLLYDSSSGPVVIGQDRKLPYYLIWETGRSLPHTITGDVRRYHMFISIYI
jgi:hypothetical protein